MAFVNTADKYGDETTVAILLDRTIDEYLDDSVTTIRPYCFWLCTALTLVDVPSVTHIQSNAMLECSVLTSLVLRNTETVVTISSTNVLKSTPIASGTGYIYVPAALVDSYKAATNWSTYADQFRALEDYTVDGTTTGELDETKI